MSFLETFSPPLDVTLISGEVVSFRRMLMEDWEILCNQLKDERFKEAQKIVAADKTLNPGERVVALRRAQDEDVDLYEVMAKLTRTAKGVVRLLEYAITDPDKKPLLKIIEPHVVARITDEIVYRPLIPKDTKPSVPPLESSAGTNDASATSETGTLTPPSSGDSSASIPASSPSDPSLNTATG